MAIDPANPLLNGPRRTDARPVVRFPTPPATAPAAGLRLSEAEILAARTPAGSWTRAPGLEAAAARWPGAGAGPAEA